MILFHKWQGTPDRNAIIAPMKYGLLIGFKDVKTSQLNTTLNISSYYT